MLCKGRGEGETESGGFGQNALATQAIRNERLKEGVAPGLAVHGVGARQGVYGAVAQCFRAIIRLSPHPQQMHALTHTLCGGAPCSPQALETVGALSQCLCERLSLSLNTLVPALAGSLGSANEKVGGDWGLAAVVGIMSANLQRDARVCCAVCVSVGEEVVGTQEARGSGR